MKNLNQNSNLILSVEKTTHSSALKVADQLAMFGIGNEFLQSFEQKIEEAEMLESVELNRLNSKELTIKKNKMVEKCLIWSRGLRLRIEITFGKKSDEMAMFPKKLLQKAYNDDKALVNLMQVLIDFAEKHTGKLNSFGQFPEFIESGSDLLKQFRNKEMKQEIRKVTNTTETRLRVKKFNELYDIINLINKAGRLIFKNEPSKLVFFKSPWPKNRNTKRPADINSQSLNTHDMPLEVQKMSA